MTNEPNPGWGTSSHDGVTWSQHMLASCPEHGQIAAGAEHDQTVMQDMLRVHFEHYHSKAWADLELGVDYTVEPAGIRCDLCNVPTEAPYWSHHAFVPINSPGVIDHDQKWLLCTTCHAFLAEKQRKAWVTYAVTTSRQYHGGEEIVDRTDFYRRRITQLMQHLDGGTLVS